MNLKTRVQTLIEAGPQTRTILVMFALSAIIVGSLIPSLYQMGYDMAGHEFTLVVASWVTVLAIGIAVDLANLRRRRR